MQKIFYTIAIAAVLLLAAADIASAADDDFIGPPTPPPEKQAPDFDTYQRGDDWDFKAVELSGPLGQHDQLTIHKPDVRWSLLYLFWLIWK